MDTYKQKWTSLETAIFSLLCLRAGEKLSQRDIAGLLGVTPTAVAKPLAHLKAQNFARIEKTKTINFVSFNRDEEKAIQLKRVDNLRNIYLSGLSDHLKTKLPGAVIILFGSYSLGEDTHTSDIDIAVIGRKELTLELERFEKSLRRDINVNFYTTWKSIHEHLRNNILNGIVLQGSVEV